MWPNNHVAVNQCPTCFRDMRCDSEHLQYRCQGQWNHEGPHWACTGPQKAIRWGFFCDVGCYDNQCRLPPGHEGWHTDRRGRSWIEEEKDE